MAAEGGLAPAQKQEGLPGGFGCRRDVFRDLSVLGAALRRGQAAGVRKHEEHLLRRAEGLQDRLPIPAGVNVDVVHGLDACGVVVQNDDLAVEPCEGGAERLPRIGCMGRQTVKRVGRDGCVLLHGVRPSKRYCYYDTIISESAAGCKRASCPSSGSFSAGSMRAAGAKGLRCYALRLSKLSLRQISPQMLLMRFLLHKRTAILMELPFFSFCAMIISRARPRPRPGCRMIGDQQR